MFPDLAGPIFRYKCSPQQYLDAMKKLLVYCLFALPVCCACQNKSDHYDAIFKKFCRGGVLLETELSKLQFDTSEAIIVKGIAKNCSKTDSTWFTVTPTGATYCMSFRLQNLLGGGAYTFQDFDLIFSNSEIVQPDFKTIHRNLAPGEHVEVFSFDLRKIENLSIKWGGPIKQILFYPGVYEFSWSIAGSFGLSKPVFFEKQ